MWILHNIKSVMLIKAWKRRFYNDFFILFSIAFGFGSSLRFCDLCGTNPYCTWLPYSCMCYERIAILQRGNAMGNYPRPVWNSGFAESNKVSSFHALISFEVLNLDHASLGLRKVHLFKKKVLESSLFLSKAGWWTDAQCQIFHRFGNQQIPKFPYKM